VGNRELLEEGRLLQDADQRLLGQQLLQQFEGRKKALNAHLLEPCLNYVLERHPSISRLVLIASNQPEGVPEHHRRRDTLFIAEVLKKLVQERFKGRVNQVVARSVRCEITAYDEVYQCLGHLLDTEPQTGVQYLCPFAGTPAMTIALVFQGVLHFRRACRLLYVPEGSPRAEEREFPIRLLKELERERFVQEVEALDFAAAARLVEGWRNHICQYALKRLLRDFRGARLALEEALKDTEAPRERLRNIRNGLLQELEEAAREDSMRKVLPCLEELYYNARLIWERGAYDDFLVRLTTFEELAARYLVEERAKLPTGERAEFCQAVRSNPHLQAFLESCTWEGQPLEWKRMGLPTFLEILRYLGERGLDAQGEPLLTEKEQESIKELHSLLVKLDCLRRWRNRFVHRWGSGISREGLLSEYTAEAGEGASPLEGMRRILELLGRTTDQDPFYEAKELLLADL
jgi:hypothetical protein